MFGVACWPLNQDARIIPERFAGSITGRVPESTRFDRRDEEKAPEVVMPGHHPSRVEAPGSCRGKEQRSAG